MHRLRQLARHAYELLASRGSKKESHADKERDINHSLKLESNRTPKEMEHERRVANDRDQAVKKM